MTAAEEDGVATEGDGGTAGPPPSDEDPEPSDDF